jgi:hypothetical protein
MLLNWPPEPRPGIPRFSHTAAGVALRCPPIAAPGGTHQVAGRFSGSARSGHAHPGLVALGPGDPQRADLLAGQASPGLSHTAAGVRSAMPATAREHCMRLQTAIRAGLPGRFSGAARQGHFLPPLVAPASGDAHRAGHLPGQASPGFSRDVTERRRRAAGKKKAPATGRKNMAYLSAPPAIADVGSKGTDHERPPR